MAYLDHQIIAKYMDIREVSELLYTNHMFFNNIRVDEIRRTHVNVDEAIVR